MPASFRASATTAVGLPRLCAILAHHSCSALVLSVFHRRGKKVAAVALARKPAGILYAMWRDGTGFGARPPHALSALGEAA
jgi:hypothetical protein